MARHHRRQARRRTHRPEDTALEPTRGELANFINNLHYALGFPDVGIYFMGAVSVLYGLALVSGVLLHLPRLKKDLLAVRHGRNLNASGWTCTTCSACSACRST